MLRYFFCAFLLLAIGCAKEVPLPDPPASAPKPAASASLPAVAVEAPVSGKGPLGRLGLSSEAPAGMCWLDIAETSPDNPLLKTLAPNLAETSLQVLAMAVNCQELQNWRANHSQLPVTYFVLAQKMNERVGSGGGNQSKERWMMVQALGGNFGFFPQDQYANLPYLTAEGAKLGADGGRQLGEVRRDDMALYTVNLKRRGQQEAQLLLTQYSQLRGTPVALLWYKPVSKINSLSAQIMNASAYLSGLVRQSDDPRLASSAPAPQQPPLQQQPLAQQSAAPTPPLATTPNSAAQQAAEGLIGGPSSHDIIGWEKAAFGMTPAQLRESYTLANPLREDLHGKAFYLDGRTAMMGRLEFKVLFDFSDSPMGPQRLGRIIFTSNTSGGNTAQLKADLLADINSRFGQPSSDASANGGPIVWDRPSGKANLQIMTSNASTVWLVVLEAKKK